MFYDIFKKLCDERGITVSKAAQEIGINKATVTRWKCDGYTPHMETLKKVADYFGVTTDYLLGVEQKNTAPEAEDGTLAEATALFARLPEDQRSAVLTLLREIVNK